MFDISMKWTYLTYCLDFSTVTSGLLLAEYSIYNVFIIFQTFLSKKQYDHLHNSLLNETKYLRSKLKIIDINIILNSLGFPKNWDLTCEISK